MSIIKQLVLKKEILSLFITAVIIVVLFIIAPAATLPEEEIVPTNWGLIGGIIAGVMEIIVLLQYFLWWRPRMI